MILTQQLKEVYMGDDRVHIPERLLTHARDRNVVVMVGTGMSAGPPSSLPGWDKLNGSFIEFSLI